MKIIRCSQKGFDRLWNKIAKNVCVNPVGITNPYMTREEKKEALNKAFNPDKPTSITYHGNNGIFHISVDRKFK